MSPSVWAKTSFTHNSINVCWPEISSDSLDAPFFYICLLSTLIWADSDRNETREEGTPSWIQMPCRCSLWEHSNGYNIRVLSSSCSRGPYIKHRRSLLRMLGDDDLVMESYILPDCLWQTLSIRVRFWLIIRSSSSSGMTFSDCDWSLIQTRLSSQTYTFHFVLLGCLCLDSGPQFLVIE